MSHSKHIKGTVLALSGTTILLLLYAVNWTRSAELSDLPPIITVLGNFHPILLHLPIGIFIYIGITEAWNFLAQAFFRRGQIRGGMPMLIFGTVTAVMAAFAGLLLYLQGDYSGELIDRHMNWGTGFAISSLVVLCSAMICKENSQIYRVVLFLSIGLLSVAAHQGGLITHGDPLEPLFVDKELVEEAKPVEELLTYDVVDKIFQSRCYSCHSVGKKQKGGLLMDSYEALLAGGKEGNALVPGKLEESKVSTYAHLPLEDEHHMPPEGKPQLTDQEILFIDQWILAGASPDKLLIEQELPREQFDWAVAYMGTPLQIDEPTEIIEIPEETQVDLDTLIKNIEESALNSVTRVGAGGDNLSFTAINAHDTVNDDTVNELIQAGPFLTDVDLSNTSVCTCAVQRIIEATPSLTRLNLSKTQVSARSIDSLIELESIRSLNLFNAQLAPNALPVLKQLNQLSTLYIAETGLNPDQVEELRQALPEVEVVADDFLSRNSPKPPEDAKETMSEPDTIIE